MASNGETDCKLGFLTAIELPGGGHVGGLLVTNRFGRPLEFQCTTPVKPNRTQEILYGPTLRPFVLGELIGKTLVEKATVKPDLVLTEDDELLEVRPHIDRPAGTVCDGGDMRLGKRSIRFHADHGSDETKLGGKAAGVPDHADLTEPFDRIREALQETLRAGTGR